MANSITLTIEDVSGERVSFADTVDRVFRHETEPDSFRIICLSGNGPEAEGPSVCAPIQSNGAELLETAQSKLPS